MISRHTRRRKSGCPWAGLSLVPACMLLLSGCGSPPPTVLGIAPDSAAPVSIASVAFAAPGSAGKAAPPMGALQAGTSKQTKETRAAGSAARQVTLQGEMVEKCPVAGCWFKLRDKTGVIRVDTKAAGFVVSDVPLHAQMTVQGKLVPGAEAQIAATGLRY